MKLISNLAFFFLYSLIILSFVSCESEYNSPNVIPNVYINTKISTSRNPVLGSNSTGTVIILKDYIGRDIGYKGHGIIVTKMNSETYFAFDATCTNHGSDFSYPLIISNKLGVECEYCNTIYDPISGLPTTNNPKNIHLHPYKCDDTGNGYLIIQSYK